MSKFNWNRVAALSVLMATAGVVRANVITFDEFAADNSNGPLSANRYSSLGITFNAATSGSTWAGISEGDPGNWGLEGTNGSIFAGFNTDDLGGHAGDSYGLSTAFSGLVQGFSLDVASSGSFPETFTLEGLLLGNVVETHTVTLANAHQWQTVSLSTTIDATRWIGDDPSHTHFHPFGVDNLQWNPVPEPGSLACLGLGLAALIRTRRLRK